MGLGFSRRVTCARGLAIGIVAVFGAGLALTATIPAAAYSSTMAVSIASTMTLSRSYVEVEFPVAVTCDPIGAFESYVYVHLAQAHTGATGSETVSPLTCDSSPHTYVAHVFADNTPFQDGPTAATAYAQNIAQNFVQQSGSASTTTTLAVGTVAVSATGVTSSTTGSTYSVSIGGRATLDYRVVNGKGYAEAFVPLTVTCTPPTTLYSPWIGASVEEADGARLVVGNDGQSNSNFQQPALICDSQAHSYTWTLFGSTSTAPYDGFLPGNLSVAVWIENDFVSPQGSTGARNVDALSTVHATNG